MSQKMSNKKLLIQRDVNVIPPAESLGNMTEDIVNFQKSAQSNKSIKKYINISGSQNSVPGQRFKMRPVNIEQLKSITSKNAIISTSSPKMQSPGVSPGVVQGASQVVNNAHRFAHNIDLVKVINNINGNLNQVKSSIISIDDKFGHLNSRLDNLEKQNNQNALIFNKLMDRRFKRVSPPSIIPFVNKTDIESFENAGEEVLNQMVEFLSQQGGSNVGAAAKLYIEACFKDNIDALHSVTYTIKKPEPGLINLRTHKFRDVCLAAMTMSDDILPKPIKGSDFDSDMQRILRNKKENMRKQNNNKVNDKNQLAQKQKRFKADTKKLDNPDGQNEDSSDSTNLDNENVFSSSQPIQSDNNGENGAHGSDILLSDVNMQNRIINVREFKGEYYDSLTGEKIPYSDMLTQFEGLDEDQYMQESQDLIQ